MKVYALYGRYADDGILDIYSSRIAAEQYSKELIAKFGPYGFDVEEFEVIDV